MSVQELPAAIRDALRQRGLIQPRDRPYADVVAALDEVAAMPEAADPAVASLLSHERLGLLGRRDVDDDEVERVLQREAATLAAMSTHERAWTLRCVCWERADLSERYLAPLLADIEGRASEDRDSATVEILRVALSVARGEPQDDDDLDDREPVQMAPDELVDGIRYAYRLKRLGWPYEEVLASLDELAARPVATGYEGWIARDRLILTDIYERPDEDMEREIERALPIFQREPLNVRASTIAAACSERPALAEGYIPPLIDALDEALRQRPDAEGEATLAGIERILARTRAG
jgi:hypothetical protein